MDFFGTLLSGIGFQSRESNKASVEECSEMVIQLLGKCKIDASSTKINVENGLGWVIEKGSASIFIIIAKNEFIDESTLEVFSPILKLPTQNILPFYRRCLELNRIMVGCALCVQKDQVMVLAERPLQGISYEEIESIVMSVANAADKLDDDLAEEFGAYMIGQS